MFKLISLRLIAAAAMLVLMGCGGGGSTSGAGVTATTSTGTFLDSPVQGLRYTTATRNGMTDADGSFQYVPGESVRFSIGNLSFRSTTGKAIITPLDVVGSNDVTSDGVSNLLVLLQSLDADANPANGIRIPDAAHNIMPTGIDLGLPHAGFRTNTHLLALLSSALGAGRTLVSEASARAHFQSSLNAGTAGSKVNIAPHAQASAPQTLPQGSRVLLDGSASNDANADVLAYQWTLIDKPPGSNSSLAGANTAVASFVPDAAGRYTAQLQVFDTSQARSTSTVVVTALSTNNAPAGYNLVWADEFNSSGAQLPDASKWTYDTYRNSVGWYNNELQYYSNARTQNSVVQSGSLFITARRESLAGSVSDWGRQSYTSARLITKGKASWTYGFFDIRAKLPCGAGTWPAIWSLGASSNTWPDQGEIDIMEQTGWDKTTVLGTIHTLAGSGGNGSTGSTTVNDSCLAFHNYQIKWTPDAIAFYIDGVPFRQPYTKPANTSGWPFDRPQYLLLNVAVGGVLGGAVNDATLSATALEVDYVRVYQLP